MLLRLALSNWRLIITQTANAALRTENARLKQINPRESIWIMRKAELIEVAIAELGLTRVQADNKTVDELRELLRVSRNQTREEQDPLLRLPVGLSKMSAEAMVAECTRRAISVAPVEGQKGIRKTRPQMMIEIRNDVDRRAEAALQVEKGWHMPMAVDAGAVPGAAAGAAAAVTPAGAATAVTAQPPGSGILNRRVRGREAV